LCNYYSPIDRILALQAVLVEREFPDWTFELFGFFGDTPEFRTILKEHGPQIIPVIWYHIENDSIAVNVESYAGRFIEFLKDKFNGKEIKYDWSNLNPVQRAWRSVLNIYEQGHAYLDECETRRDEDGTINTQWIITNRFTSILTGIMLDGVENLETKFRMGEEVTLEDAAWAVLDVTVIGSASLKAAIALKGAKLAKVTIAGVKVAKTGKVAVISSKVAKYGSTVLKSKVVKWGVVVGTAYYAVTHPSLLNDAVGAIASFTGTSPWAIWFWLIVIALGLILNGLYFALTPVWKTYNAGVVAVRMAREKTKRRK